MSDIIDTLGGAIVMVSDQEKTLEFFTQKLGFEEKENMPIKMVEMITVSNSKVFINS